MKLVFCICHYEDEPGKVDFPELIEALLYDKGKNDCSINFNDQRSRYDIEFSDNKKNINIHYLVEDSYESMLDELHSLNAIRLLSIVDASFYGDHDAGIEIIDKLINIDKIETSKIWMVTGYSAKASVALRTRNYDIKVISKPANHMQISSDIVKIIENAMNI